MADLVRVRFKSGPDKGKETTVGRAWLTRWPGDFEEVVASPAPVGEQKKTASAVRKPARAKRKE